eukprot:scaffold7432_cov107-Isochrysis_galbana.AAC.16
MGRGRGGVSGRHGTEVSRRVAASVVSEKRSSASSFSVARGDSLAWCALRDGGGSPLLMARSCFVRASCASASAKSANLLKVHLQTKLGSKGWFSSLLLLGGLPLLGWLRQSTICRRWRSCSIVPAGKDGSEILVVLDRQQSVRLRAWACGVAGFALRRWACDDMVASSDHDPRIHNSRSHATCKRFSIENK